MVQVEEEEETGVGISGVVGGDSDEEVVGEDPIAQDEELDEASSVGEV